MPKAAPKPCSYPGCGRLVLGGSRCEQHPRENRFADSRRGSRHERGYGSSWDKRRERVLYRDEGLCQPCLKAEPSRITPATEVDHVMNKATARQMGWSDEQIDADANLQGICRACHKAKTAEEARRGRGV